MAYKLAPSKKPPVLKCSIFESSNIQSKSKTGEGAAAITNPRRRQVYILKLRNNTPTSLLGSLCKKTIQVQLTGILRKNSQYVLVFLGLRIRETIEELTPVSGRTVVKVSLTALN